MRTEMDCDGRMHELLCFALQMQVSHELQHLFALAHSEHVQ